MNGIHEVGGSIPPGSTIHHLFLFLFSSLVAVIGTLIGLVSTYPVRCSIMRIPSTAILFLSAAAV